MQNTTRLSPEAYTIGACNTADPSINPVKGVDCANLSGFDASCGSDTMCPPCCNDVHLIVDDSVQRPIAPASKARNQKQSSPDLRLQMGAAPYVPALARIPRNLQALRSAFAPESAVNLAGDSAGDDRFTSFDVLSQAIILRREAAWDPPRCLREALHRTLIPNPSGRLMVTQIPDMPGPQLIIQTFRNLRTHRAVVFVCDSCTPTHTVCEYPLGMSLRAFVFGLSLEPAHPWADMASRMLSYTCTVDYQPVACTQALSVDADVVQIFVTTTTTMHEIDVLQDTLPISGLPTGHNDAGSYQPGGPRPPVPPIPPLGRQWGTSTVFGLLGPDATLTIPTQATSSFEHEAVAPFDAAEGTFVVFDEYLHMRILELPHGAAAHQTVDIAYANTAQLPMPRGHRFLHHAVPGLPAIQLCIWGQLAVGDIVLPFLAQDARRPICTTRVAVASTPFEAALEVESACGYGSFLHQGLQRRQIHLSINGHPAAPHSRWALQQADFAGFGIGPPRTPVMQPAARHASTAPSSIPVLRRQDITHSGAYTHVVAHRPGHRPITADAPLHFGPRQVSRLLSYLADDGHQYHLHLPLVMPTCTGTPLHCLLLPTCQAWTTQYAIIDMRRVLCPLTLRAFHHSRSCPYHQLPSHC